MAKMMTDTNKIRSYMEIINEASLKDIASSVGTSAKAALGDDEAKGKKQAEKLAAYLEKKFKAWLGQTGNKADESALMTFLVSKIGFTAANARKLFAEAGVQDPTKAGEEPQAEPAKTTSNTKDRNAEKQDPPMESINEALDKGSLRKVLLTAAQFAYKYDLIDDPDDKTGIKKQGGTYGSNYSRRRNSGDEVADAAGKIKSAADKDGATDPNAHGTGPGQSTAPTTDPSYTLDKFKFLGALKDAGISDRKVLADLRSIVANSKSYNELKKTPQELQQLAMIGYAVFKAQQK